MQPALLRHKITPKPIFTIVKLTERSGRNTFFPHKGYTKMKGVVLQTTGKKGGKPPMS